MRTALIVIFAAGLVRALANPMTYTGKNGKQYVVIEAGDQLLAFALP